MMKELDDLMQIESIINKLNQQKENPTVDILVDIITIQGIPKESVKLLIVDFIAIVVKEEKMKWNQEMIDKLTSLKANF